MVQTKVDRAVKLRELVHQVESQRERLLKQWEDTLAKLNPIEMQEYIERTGVTVPKSVTVDAPRLEGKLNFSGLMGALDVKATLEEGDDDGEEDSV